ncbi:MAG: N-(5'-phosphoribosyl)anthranilate isomerase [Methanoregula sp. PtaU1.Bin051]|nr:MAG: N-(5'-phosphoribosyl)anthranilate isomerase [Methanoregula sp. PtaU1.Bin051]
MRVKICGITRPDDARFAEQEGADAIGVILSSPGSKREVSPKRAQEIFEAVGPFITKVAVTHTGSESELSTIIALNPDAIQIFHPFVFGKDPGVQIIRAIGKDDPLPSACDAIIIDESHGGGKDFDLSAARSAVQRAKVPVILAGGLTPGNVEEAIQQVRPYAVDVATGVELSPGIKDHRKVRAFIAACRRA